MASLNAFRTLGNGVSRTSFATQSTVNQLGGIREGSNLKEIRRRIKSVKSIQKITKTMKMIASSRLREAQNKMEAARPFYIAASKISEGDKVESKKRTLIIPICTDRGLCGALNTSVVKQTKLTVKELEDSGNEAVLVCVGDKGGTQLARDHGNQILWSAGGTGKKTLNFNGASMIADRILESDFDSATIIYNRFNSVISNTTVAEDLNSFKGVSEKLEKYADYEFEDDQTQFHVRDLLEYQLGSLIFEASAENSAAELGSRMSAMDNATRNASDMIKKLNITYNRGRQAAITTELTEIISGAAAVE